STLADTPPRTTPNGGDARAGRAPCRGSGALPMAATSCPADKLLRSMPLAAPAGAGRRSAGPAVVRLPPKCFRRRARLCGGVPGTRRGSAALRRPRRARLPFGPQVVGRVGGQQPVHARGAVGAVLPH